MKKLRAILIDPFTMNITEHEIDSGIDAIYKLGQYESFDVIELPNGDTIYVDDEGLFKGRQQDATGMKRGFVVLKHEDDFNHSVLTPPLIGRGVILGVNKNTGNSINVKTKVSDLAVAFFRTSNSI